MMALFGFITFSHGNNQNQQGGVSLWCGMQYIVVVWWHFHVAVRNFEVIHPPPTLNK